MNAYLQFARGDGQEEPERVGVVGLMKRLKQSFEREGMKVQIDTDLEEQFLFLKPVAMERAITNIFSNAQKYAESLTVSVLQNDESLKLYFDDDGAGVKPENYEDVFKPFYREETSRNQKTGGTGLGLPITKDIILAHGGDITLDKSPKGGLRVIIELPL